MAVVILCVDVAYVDLQTRFSMQTYTELGAEAVSSLSEGGLMFQASADRLDLTVFVAGAGQAGARVAQGLRAAGHRGAIVVVGEEVHAPYERPPLSKELLLGERTVEDLAVVSAVEWAALGVDTRLGLRVAGFDRDAGRARLSDGTTVDFDVAVIATGGSAVYSRRAMTRLKSDGLVVFLDLPLAVLERRIHNYCTRGLAKPPEQSFADMFQERRPLYSSYADITITPAGLPQEEVCGQIMAQLQTRRSGFQSR